MRFAAAVAAAFAALGVVSATASADSYEVTRTDDPAPGTCDVGDCSLREAVTAANGDTASDVVVLPAGTYTLSLGPLPELTNPLTIAGAGAGSTRITGSTATGASTTTRAGVVVAESTSLTVLGVTLSGNTATVTDPTTQSITVGAGAIVANSSSLTVIDSVIADNNQTSQTTVGAGGLAVNLGTLTLVGSTVSGNRKTVSGTVVAGGIASNVGSAVLRDSTVSGNQSDVVTSTVAAGGFISNVAEAKITNTTISGNSVLPGETGDAGGFRGTSDADTITAVVASTIANNSGGASAAANLDLNDPEGAFVTSTIIAGGGARPNCRASAINSGGSNLEDANTCGFAGPGDLVNANPLLGPLQDNGGRTFTHALGEGSPAIDAVQGAAAASCPAADQRGVRRPQRARCDIGAFELEPPAPIAAPANTDRPGLSGTARRGLRLTCGTGTWSGSPTFAFAWLRNGRTISGATSNRYRLTSRDVGRALQCRVTSTNAGGSTAMESIPRVGAQACIVPRLRGNTLRRATRRLRRAHCRRGRITRAFSSVAEGRVVRSRPGAGANRREDARVRLTLSRGRRP